MISFVPHNQENERWWPILLAEYMAYMKIVNDLLQNLEQVTGFLLGIRIWGRQWARWMISGNGWHIKRVQTCYMGTRGVRVKPVDKTLGEKFQILAKMNRIKNAASMER